MPRDWRLGVASPAKKTEYLLRLLLRELLAKPLEGVPPPYAERAYRALRELQQTYTDFPTMFCVERFIIGKSFQGAEMPATTLPATTLPATTLPATELTTILRPALVSCVHDWHQTSAAFRSLAATVLNVLDRRTLAGTVGDTCSMLPSFADALWYVALCVVRVHCTVPGYKALGARCSAPPHCRYTYVMTGGCDPKCEQLTAAVEHVVHGAVTAQRHVAAQVPMALPVQWFDALDVGSKPADWESIVFAQVRCSW